MMDEKRRALLTLLAMLEQVKAEGIRTLVPERILQNVSLVAESPAPERTLTVEARIRFYAKCTIDELYALCKEYDRAGYTILFEAARQEQQAREAIKEKAPLPA